MIAVIYVVLLIAALAGTGVTLRIATSTSQTRAVRYATALAASTVVLWLLVTIGSFNIVTVSGGSELTHSYPSLGAVGVLGVALSTLVLVKGSVELLNET